jgi:hypothetical protein
MIPIRFGFRFAGMVALASGAIVATRVFHIWYVPIFPLGTYQMTGEDQGVPTKFSLLSLGAAFFNAWGWLAAIGLTAAALGAGHRDPFYAMVAAAAVLFGLVYASWLFLGRPREDRPSAGAYAIIGGFALVSFGVLGYGVVDHRGSALESAFSGRVPAADSAMSAVTMGDGHVRAVPATERDEVQQGQMVEIAVPGGYAHGVVSSTVTANDEWVQIQAGSDQENFFIRRDAVTVLDVE